MVGCVCVLEISRLERGGGGVWRRKGTRGIAPLDPLEKWQLSRSAVLLLVQAIRFQHSQKM